MAVKVRFYEVESRPVVVRSADGISEAFVWRDGAWFEAPGLVLKSVMEGSPLSESGFVAEFPEADLGALPTRS